LEKLGSTLSDKAKEFHHIIKIGRTHLMDATPVGKQRESGTGHGTPYNYDQHVPVIFMGYGIRPGEYHGEVTPADIAPTLASLCGITLATRDGHVLAEALANSGASH
jgi:arylsulfatase A-like enzyme